MIQIDEFLLNRFFMDEATPEEIAAIRDWVNASGKNRERFQKAFDLYAATTLAVARIQELPESVLLEKRKTGRRTSFVKKAVLWAGSMAAAVVLGFFLHRVLSPSLEQVPEVQMMSITAENGHQTRIVLADSTTVSLSSGTTLRYPTFFGQKREVSIEGQALFDVAKDIEHPFIVHTYNYDVTVTGTRIDVLAYEEKDVFSTALIEGSVTVSDLVSKREVHLVPGDVVSARQGSPLAIVHTEEAMKQQLYWTEGVLSLGGLSFEEVIQVFERAFGVNIVIECAKMPVNHSPHMKVYVSDGIESALEILKKSASFSYVFDSVNNTYLIH